MGSFVFSFFEFRILGLGPVGFKGFGVWGVLFLFLLSLGFRVLGLGPLGFNGFGVLGVFRGFDSGLRV